MQRFKTLVLVIFCVSISLLSSAQFDYLNIYAGTVFYPKDEKINAQGVSESVFGGYSNGIKAGVGVEKYFTDNIGASVNMDYTMASKPRYNMSQLKFDLNIKYSFLRYSTLSPYVFVGGNISFFSVKQDEFIDPNFYQVDSTNQEEIIVRSQQPRFGSLSANFVPVLGFVGGGGLSLRVNEWFSIFGEYAFNYYLNKQATFIKGNFPINNTALTNSTLQAGVKIDLY